MSKAGKVSGGGFSPLVMIAIILVGVFSFAAFFTLTAFESELTDGSNGRAHAMSRSAVGFAAVVRLAQADGMDVHVSRQSYDERRLDGLVVITPERPITTDELFEVGGASTLIVLPKWRAGPHPTHRGWANNYGVIPPELIGALLGDLTKDVRITQSPSPTSVTVAHGAQAFQSGPIENLQTISGPEVTSVVVDNAGRTVLGIVQNEDVQIYVLADPDLLNTYGMSNLRTARAGLAILDTASGGQPILFDVTMNGLGASRSALRLAFEPPFLGATLTLAIAAGLLGWRAAVRAGRSAAPSRAIALGKEALADNTAALLRLSRREHKLGGGYARLIASTFSGLGAKRDESETAAALDRISAAHNVTPSYSDLAREAELASNPRQMLEAARKLHAWKKEIARATR